MGARIQIASRKQEHDFDTSIFSVLFTWPSNKRDSVHISTIKSNMSATSVTMAITPNAESCFSSTPTQTQQQFQLL